MNKSIISIVTPSFNQGEFIDKTILSVISQSGDFYIDYIIMDGLSTDNSVNIIKKYSNIYLKSELVMIDSNLSYRKINGLDNISTQCLGISFRWFSEKDNGQTHAINKGWRLATGSIIAWLNSDDIYMPNTFEKITTLLHKADTVAVYGIGLHIDIQDRVLEFYPIETYSQNRLIDYCFICQPTVFLKRRILNSVGYLNESLDYCMDYEYWLRVSKNYSFYFLQDILACTRIHENTKTSQNFNVHQEIVKMQKSTVGRVSNHWIYYYSKYFITNKYPNIKNLFLLKIFITLYSNFLTIKYKLKQNKKLK